MKHLQEQDKELYDCLISYAGGLYKPINDFLWKTPNITKKNIINYKMFPNERVFPCIIKIINGCINKGFLLENDLIIYRNLVYMDSPERQRFRTYVMETNIGDVIDFKSLISTTLLHRNFIDRKRSQKNNVRQNFIKIKVPKGTRCFCLNSMDEHEILLLPGKLIRIEPNISNSNDGYTYPFFEYMIDIGNILEFVESLKA